MVTNLSEPSLLLLSSFLLFLGRSVQQLNFEFPSRNCLLGKRKKIAKFFMRTFTCRSTFLYKRSIDQSSAQRRRCIFLQIPQCF
jgi:hypothetical protein